MRSINGSIDGQLLQAVVVVNRPPFRGALTPAPRTAEADAALGAACRKQMSPIRGHRNPFRNHTRSPQ